MAKCFISGRITGDPHYKFKFHKASFLLSNRGHVVINPALLPLGMEHDEYLHICRAMIDTCEVFVQLPDWKDSDGATKELAYITNVDTTKKRFTRDLKIVSLEEMLKI